MKSIYKERTKQDTLGFVKALPVHLSCDDCHFKISGTVVKNYGNSQFIEKVYLFMLYSFFLDAVQKAG